MIPRQEQSTTTEWIWNRSLKLLRAPLCVMCRRVQETARSLLTWEEGRTGCQRAAVETNLTASEVLLLSCARRVTARRAHHQHFPSPDARSASARRRRRRRRSLAHSIARTQCGVGDGGGGGGRLRRASRLPGAVRHACARARHHCASRASSTFPFPPRAIGVRALRRRRLSLAHSIARTRCGGGDGGGGGSRLRLTSRASRSTCVTRARYVIITRRARHQLSLPPMRDRYARGGGGGGARSLARSITRTRCVAVAKAVAVAVGYAARHARPRHATCASRTRMRVSPPRVARVINVSLSPARDRHARAAAAAALARSLDRAHAVWRWRWRWRWRWWWL